MRIRQRFLAAILIVITLFLGGSSCQKPPLGSLQKARDAVKEAAHAGALRYAEHNYRRAQELVRKGWLEMARQDARLAPFRDYKKADSILVLAAKAADEATQISRDLVRNLDSLARNERHNLQIELQNWREALDGSLEDIQAEKYWAAAFLALDISDRLIRNGECEEAMEAVRKGRDSLRKLEDAVADYINDQARKIAAWRQWVRETLADSRAQGTYAVIIDKSSHKAYLVDNGELVRSYECELGYNAAHQKLFSGDGATPEGLYKVTKIRNNSRFHRALLLNYPNQMDLNRFKNNKARGIISRHARIGALIEMHGEGGKNKDWTDGCIALTNNDIDHLLQYVSIGTPVTIVRKSDQWP